MKGAPSKWDAEDEGSSLDSSGDEQDNDEVMDVSEDEGVYQNSVFEEEKPDEDLLSDRYCLHRHYDKHKRATFVPCEDGTIEFQHTETTYYVQPGTEIPIVRLWGITKDGNTVCVEDSSFRPYFYVQAQNRDHADRLRSTMEQMYREHFPVRKRGHVSASTYILGVEEMQGRTIMGYHKNMPTVNIYKFTVALPAHVAVGRDWLEGANRRLTPERIVTYEANVPYELRYMIDRNIHGCEWITIAGGSYFYQSHQRTTSQVEICICDASGIVAHRPEQKGGVAPMRFLGYDIEVYRREPGFPTAEENRVIMICCVLYVPGAPNSGVIHKACFALKGNAFYNRIEGANIYVYDTEAEMLMAFHQYVHETDPDGFTGWNTNNFDMPFLLTRAKVLGIGQKWPILSRVKDSPLWVRKSTFQSRANGARANNEVNCEGRFDFDGLTFMLRAVMRKFRLYGLNAIAKDLLGQEKADVDYSQIADLFDSEYSDDCTRLLFYCLRDTELVMTILHKQMAVVNCIEQARVTGVPIKWLLSRGQGVKTFSNVLRFKLQGEYVPSKANKANQEVTGGGHVEDPERGFYPFPVNTMDFASLYPSIMIAYNICYSTKVSLAWARANLDPKDYWVPFPSVDAPELHQKEKVVQQKKQSFMAKFVGSKKAAPVAMEPERKKSKKDRDREEKEAAYAGKEPDFCFVKKHIREGILPAMLAKLLAARSNVKRMMRTAEGFEYGVLDGRQLALKVVCNSVYGFLKAHTIVDPDLMAAVTSYGRNMLRIVKNVIHTKFNHVEIIDWDECVRLNMDPEDETNTNRPIRYATGRIVYGDTDSVMVYFGAITLFDAIRIGRLISAACTAEFEKPNKLEFETVKLRSAFVNKKRYMALYIEEFKEGETLQQAINRAKMVMKGLEGARRDNARIGSRTQTEAATVLLKTASIEQAEAIVKKVLSDLHCNRVDLSDLIITKGLSKTKEQYAKSGNRPPQHVAVQERMRARAHETGEVVPETGDRVPYVMVCGPKGSSAGERSEHPLFVQKNGLAIDVNYYVHKQVWPAVIRIFTAFHEPNRCTEITGSMSMPKRQTLITHKRLFVDTLEHMQVRKRPKIRNAMSSVIEVCPGCHIPYRGKATCCDVKDQLEVKKQQAEALHQKAWDTCRTCQGGNFQKVTCANLSCSNFFHRNTMTMDMEDATAELARYLTRNGGATNRC